MPGTVTNQSGPATFTDVIVCDKQPPEFGWQYPVWLSTQTGMCARYLADKTQTPLAAGEARLLVVLAAFRCYPDGRRDAAGNPIAASGDMTPVPFPSAPLATPVTVNPATAIEFPAGSGNAYIGSATYQPAKGSQKAATAGQIVWQLVTADQARADYQLTTSAGVFAGSFDAPHCVP